MRNLRPVIKVMAAALVRSAKVPSVLLAALMACACSSPSVETAIDLPGAQDCLAKNAWTGTSLTYLIPDGPGVVAASKDRYHWLIPPGAMLTSDQDAAVIVALPNFAPDGQSEVLGLGVRDGATVALLGGAASVQEVDLLDGGRSTWQTPGRPVRAAYAPSGEAWVAVASHAVDGGTVVMALSRDERVRTVGSALPGWTVKLMPGSGALVLTEPGSFREVWLLAGSQVVQSEPECEVPANSRGLSLVRRDRHLYVVRACFDGSIVLGRFTVSDGGLQRRRVIAVSHRHDPTPQLAFDVRGRLGLASVGTGFAGPELRILDPLTLRDLRFPIPFRPLPGYNISTYCGGRDEGLQVLSPTLKSGVWAIFYHGHRSGRSSGCAQLTEYQACE